MCESSASIQCNRYVIQISYSSKVIEIIRIGFAAAVQFTAEPHDVTVHEGETVKFCCMYNSGEFSSWYINGTLHHRARLTGHYEYNFDWLIVRNVTLSLNNTSFQCVLPSSGLQSAIGVLYVVPSRYLILKLSIK